MYEAIFDQFIQMNDLENVSLHMKLQKRKGCWRKKKCSSKKISLKNRRDLAVVQSHLSGGKDICRPHVALQGQEKALESEVLE